MAATNTEIASRRTAPGGGSRPAPVPDLRVLRGWRPAGGDAGGHDDGGTAIRGAGLEGPRPVAGRPVCPGAAHRSPTGHDGVAGRGGRLRVVRVPSGSGRAAVAVAVDGPEHVVRRVRHGVPAGGRGLRPRSYALRRVAVVVAAVVAAGAVGLVVWAVLQAVGGPYGMAGSPSGASPAAAVTVEVAPGDTFWSIASRLRPGGDPRPLVDRLVAANGNRTLRVGEQLSVPSH